MKEFDYYIFIDYSEDLIGYIIAEKKSLREISQKLHKLRHFKNVKHTREYLTATKRRIENEKIAELLTKCKIKDIRANIELFSEIIEFLNINKDKNILVSIDDNFYIYFIKILGILKDKVNLFVIRESKLKKDSIEYKLNLIIDNLLAIERKSE